MLRERSAIRRYKYLYNRANWTSFIKFREGIDLDNTWNTKELWTAFKTGMQTDTEKHIPTKLTRVWSSAPWLNDKLATKIKKRNKLYKRSKKYGRERDEAAIKTPKKEIQREIRQCHNNFIGQLGTPKSGEPFNKKSFWSYIKHQQKNDETMPYLKDQSVLHSQHAN